MESAAGIPIPISWPDLLVAVDFGLDEEDVAELMAEGWRVYPIGTKLFDPSAAAAALELDHVLANEIDHVSSPVDHPFRHRIWVEVHDVIAGPA